MVHEGGLVGSLIGIRARHGGEHLVQSLGGNLEDTGVQDVGPVMGREVTQGGSVDQRSGHLGRSSNLLEMRVVVANRNGGDLSVTAIMRIQFTMREFRSMTYTSSSKFPSVSAM